MKPRPVWTKAAAVALLAAFVAAVAVAVATASERRPATGYHVDWRRRYLAEHAHVQRLLRRLRDARRVQMVDAPSPQEAIRTVFGAYGDQAVRVAACETGGTFSTTARNGQYEGLFQLGDWERAHYAQSRYSTVMDQVEAAYRYFLATGSDWSPWECKP